MIDFLIDLFQKTDFKPYRAKRRSISKDHSIISCSIEKDTFLYAINLVFK